MVSVRGKGVSMVPQIRRGWRENGREWLLAVITEREGLGGRALQRCVAVSLWVTRVI